MVSRELFISLMAVIYLFSEPINNTLISKTKCEIDKDSFINICGVCVGGSTGLQDTEGLDRCEVCSGSNDCIKCDGSEGCKSLLSPVKIDLALNEAKVKVYLQDSKFKETSSDVVCSLKSSHESSDLAEANQEILVSHPEEGSMPFGIISTSLLEIGNYNIKCVDNASSDHILNSTLQVVDSRTLQILSVSPQSVSSNSYVKATIKVRSSNESIQKLLCFVKVNGLTEYVIQAASDSPGIFKCNFFVGQHMSQVLVGLTETLEAALHSSSSLNSQEIIVNVSAPTIIRSSFSSDLRLIILQFDQNINSLSKCDKAFSAETISLFGKGWHCWTQADQLIVKLGTESIVLPGSRISLSASNDIQQSGLDQNEDGILQGSTSVVDDVTNQVFEPVYSVLAPHVVCYGMRSNGLQSPLYARKIHTDDEKQEESNTNGVTILEVQQLGGQNLLYNWSISFSLTNNEHALSQRDMLMIWLSVRLLNKSLRVVKTNKVSLNNSLMLSNVDYTVTVKGTNSLGMSGEEKNIPLRLNDKYVSAEHRSQNSEIIMNACTSGFPLDVILSSTPATFCDSELRVEVSTSCCNGTLTPEIVGQIGYNWSIKSRNGSEVKVGYIHQGRYLKVPSGTLHGGERYEISCFLYHKTLNKSLGSASVSVVTLERGIQVNLNVSAVGISTKHPLILDASTSRDLDDKHGTLDFEWSCRIASNEQELIGYGDNKCYTPSREKILLHDAFIQDLKKPVLHIPPGSLPIGRYQFSVKVSRKSKEMKPSSNVVTIDVTVMGGSPPLVFIPSRDSVSSHNTFMPVINPDEGVTVTGVVKGIKAGCHVYWKAINKPGYIYLNLSMLHQEPFRAMSNDDKPREFTVELSPGLLGDAKYRLRLSALCSGPEGLGVEMSYVDIDMLTDAPPAVKSLMVEPLEGEALITVFKFSTQPAYDDLLDYPLRYSFGFHVLEEGSGTHGVTKFFHSSNEKLSATTYLPVLSIKATKIQSVLKVCDVREICHSVDGPQLISHAPTHLTTEHVELLSDGFSNFLIAEEYEEAVMLVESSMLTLEVLNNKTLYQLASKRVEKAVNTQLDLFEKWLDSSPESVNSALRFLKAANSALKHCTFSQETLQRLVSFKDKILSMLSEENKTLPEYQSDLRRKRQASKSDAEQSRSVLQPEMVRTLLSVSEVAIFNLSDTSKALSEKRKLLQNISFFMDSLCRGLHNSVPLFIGSRVVSFSVQRLNMQVKYKDDLAIPDWRSAKSGGAPINATALIRLGENVQLLMGPKIVCMGAAYYPMDFLTEVSGVPTQGLNRHSAVYQVKLIQSTMEKMTLLENYEGLDIKAQTIRVKIPIWNKQIDDEMQLECRTWWHGTWLSDFCKLTKQATLINKPAVECQCSVIGYYAVFAVESPTTTIRPSTKSTESYLPTTVVLPTQTVAQSSSTVTTSSKPTSLSTKVFQEGTKKTTSASSVESSKTQSPGTPIPNTSQNFTFKIQEEFAVTVGSNQEAFISQLKQDILKQVEMPANMIASIDVSPGSILVTLHLVDTDIRAVDDVLPSLAAVLQDGRLAINGVDGRHLSVPPQSLKLLQRRTEQSFVPWIIVGCTGFGLFSVGALIIAAIIVKRQLQETDLGENNVSPEFETKTAAYGRLYLEQTLDGSKATLSRYRESVNNPLVVSTIGGLASVMGTNAFVLSDGPNSVSHFRLQSPQSTTTPNHMQNGANQLNGNSSSSGNTSGSSGGGSTSSDSVQKRTRNGSILKQITLHEIKDQEMCNENEGNMDCDPEEQDSGIVLMNCKSLVSHNNRSQTPEFSGPLPEAVMLPGTPTGLTGFSNDIPAQASDGQAVTTIP